MHTRIKPILYYLRGNSHQRVFCFKAFMIPNWYCSQSIQVPMSSLSSTNWTTHQTWIEMDGRVCVARYLDSMSQDPGGYRSWALQVMRDWWWLAIVSTELSEQSCVACTQEYPERSQTTEALVLVLRWSLVSVGIIYVRLIASLLVQSKHVFFAGCFVQSRSRYPHSQLHVAWNLCA